jgi:glycerol-3-phosphate cytidylyltransferase
VDEVRVQPTSTLDIEAAQAWIAAWGCQQVVVGGNWQGHPTWQALATQLALRGVSVGFVPATEGISSTQLLGFAREGGEQPGSGALIEGPSPLPSPAVDRPEQSHAGSRRRVLALGVFDLFHVGHLRYLEYARRQGDELTVAVCTDVVCEATKNKRPVIPEALRLEIVRGMGCVDGAHLLPTSTEDTAAAASWIQSWGIDQVVAGAVWSGSARWRRLTPLLAQRGISVGFAPDTPGISSTDIVARMRAPQAL